MDDTEQEAAKGEIAWWAEADPRRAHEKYLRMHASDTNRAKIAVTEHLLERLEWAGRSVLEYGCGGGYFTIWMARRGAHVTAIEMNPNAIGAVRFFAEREGVADRVHVTQGNAERDTRDGDYDFIFAKDLIEHLEDDGPFFRRLGQQLRP